MALVPRRPAPGARGISLLESMIAMVVVAIGAAGTIAVNAHMASRNGEARRITEATGIAQDMVENMAGWAWDDPRLSDNDTTNNGKLGDPDRKFETATFTADHGEADLTLNSATWTGLPTRGDFQRYWNVAADGTQRRIAVIVRWPSGAGWKRVVSYTSRADMSGVATP